VRTGELTSIGHVISYSLLHVIRASQRAEADAAGQVLVFKSAYPDDINRDDYDNRLCINSAVADPSRASALLPGCSRCHQPANPIHRNLRLVGLGQRTGFAQFRRRIRGTRNVARQDHIDVRAPFAYPFGKLEPAGRAWHFDVAEDDIYCNLRMLKEYERFIGIRGLEHLIAALTQVIRDYDANEDLIFDNQDRLLARSGCVSHDEPR
jgi:hypothetical protein